MDSIDPALVAQFLLGSDHAPGKKHYHWQCNCALHAQSGQCGHSPAGSSKVVLAKNSNKSTKNKSVIAKSASVMDLAPAASLRESSRRHGSMGNLLELLDPRRSQEEIRRVAAKREPL